MDDLIPKIRSHTKRVHEWGDAEFKDSLKEIKAQIRDD